eukprot:Clim_evm49s7 gene=Clim_evmTU49s7
MSKSKVFFITAAARGFGRAIADEALSRGHRVIATGRNMNKLKDLEHENAKLMVLDVTWSQSRIQAVVDDAFKVYGRIDVLLNSAAHMLEGAVEETSAEETQDIFAVNVFGALNVTRAVLPHMRAQGSGTVAMFGSLGSWISKSSWTLYAATKWACSAIGEGLRDELKPLGITATVIEPGFFRTGFLDKGQKVESAVRIKAYEDSRVGEGRKALAAAARRQPGSTEKAAIVIVDILTHTGCGAGRDVPQRIVLGADCVETIRRKCQSTLNLVDEWETVANDTLLLEENTPGTTSP